MFAFMKICTLNNINKNVDIQQSILDLLCNHFINQDIMYAQKEVFSSMQIQKPMSQTDKLIFCPFIVFGEQNQFTLHSIIGEGSFGKVYLASETKNTKNLYAVKTQLQNNKTNNLVNECRTYMHMWNQKLSKTEKRAYIPDIFYCCLQDAHFVLVMDLMGLNLKKWIIQCTMRSKYIGLKKIYQLAIQMINAIEYVHSRGIIHRDLKPANFCMGLGKDSEKLFIIDFGLAKKYIQNGKHIAPGKVNGLIGNRVYASLAAHQHKQQSRKDDLQSVAYILIDMALGKLPWRAPYDSGTKGTAEMVYMKKKLFTFEALCLELPIYFKVFGNSVSSLTFEEDPNYEFYKNLFFFALEEIQLEMDNQVQLK